MENPVYCGQIPASPEKSMIFEYKRNCKQTGKLNPEKLTITTCINHIK